MVGVVQLVEPLIVVQVVAGSSPVTHPIDALLAQLAEQRTLNPWVPGSSPGGRTRGTCSHVPFKITVGAPVAQLDRATDF